MFSGRFVCRLLGVGILLGAATLTWATPPVLRSAVSRMTHGSAGTFDIQLPLTTSDNSGIECRTVANGLTIVLTFDQTVVSGNAAITAGTAAVSGSPTFAGSTMTVKLSGVTNAQAINLNVSNVANAASELLATQDVPLRVLLSDVNANAVLTGSDVNICRAAVASNVGVNGGNFRSDINANGILNSSDVNILRAAAAAAATVPGNPTANTAPTVGAIANQNAVSGQASTPTSFTVSDAESDPATLFVSATSSDQTIVPNSGIALGGSGANRTISVTPVANLSSSTSVTISVTATDGLAYSTPSTFTVSVVPAPTVYLATLQPIAGVSSLGSGTAILSVSGDQTYAILKYSYSNLAGNDTDDAVYAPGDQVLYDVPVGKARGDQQPDGSYKWVFSSASLSLILSTIQGNNAYMTIESSAFPAGELRGTFQKVVGSQSFTPPQPPPSITINPPTTYDASRFLQQSQFGGTSAEISALSNPNAVNASTAINDWLTAQFNSPLPVAPTYYDPSPTYSSSSWYQWIYNRVTTPQSPNAYGDNLDNNLIPQAWWRNAITAPDQLRHRVATAYSELFVVSEIDDTIDGNIPGLASYYDMLADDAFVNFRQLLGDVTLHPIMGDYLNMRGNKKATPPASPNENYAREVMQLFTIGLYMLQPDGSLQLDQNGQPIPTYDQPTITQFAQVFTGWDVDSTPVVIPTLVAPVPPATQPSVVNFNSSYQKPMVVRPGNHSTTSKQLLSYPGAATYPGASQPALIPSTTTQTSATAAAELNFALDNIFNHPNVGPFVCRQLIQRLIGSNPSPAYVYRVAQVFNNDGTGVRGNMKAVITAILTDYEARNVALTSDPGYGHCREPLVRMAQIIRSCGGFSKSGKFLVGSTDNTMSQTMFRSPTVFNFFDPHYSQPGVVQGAGLVSPEFDIIFETTVMNTQNMIYTGIYSNNYATPPSGTGFRGDNFGSDVFLDFSAAGSGLQPLAQSQGVDPMLDQVGLLLMGAPLDSTLKGRIHTFITGSLSNTDYLGQTKAAVHLIATSPQCAIQK
jgi:uncharacterized protein (DUF1800 family)